MAGEKERYSIIKRLDKGGMAEVFLARSTSLEGFEKNVAIKRVLPHLAANTRFVNMFLDEAKLSLSLEHANIVSVFDVGRSGDTYFIVMEYIDGTNLKRLIDNQAMPLDIAVYLAIEVCKGLAYAHEKNDRSGKPLKIVHRDISPPNILISREGEVKLVDFGLARAASQIENTAPGVVKGKFAYLSPEAAWGQEVDHRTDVFAVGIVLWEAITGKRLFQGNTDLETLENVRECRVPPIHQSRPDVPASLDRILTRALARNPADRYQSARELGRELSLFLVEQRMSVTSYDLASWMQDILDLPTETSRISSTLADRAIQSELERFVGMDEPDTKKAPAAKADFEDPRLWGVFDDGGVSIDNIVSASMTGQQPTLRSGTQKVGKPLTDAEAGAVADSNAMFARTSGEPGGAPARPAPPKRLPPGAVVPSKGSGARRLPGGAPPLPPPTPGPPNRRTTATLARPAITTPAAPGPAPRHAATQMMAPLDEAIFEQSGLFRPRDGALVTGTNDVSALSNALKDARSQERGALPPQTARAPQAAARQSAPPPQAPAAPPAPAREGSGLGRTHTEAIDRPVVANDPSGVMRVQPAPAPPVETPAPAQEASPLPQPIGGSGADIFASVDAAAEKVPEPVERSTKPGALAQNTAPAGRPPLITVDEEVIGRVQGPPVISFFVILASVVVIGFYGYRIFAPFLRF